MSYVDGPVAIPGIYPEFWPNRQGFRIMATGPIGLSFESVLVPWEARIMGRRVSGKPWLHQASGFWCATVGGKRQYLDRDYKEACRKLRQLIAEAKKNENGCREWCDAPFPDLADEYLSDVKARRAPGTYRNYREQLVRAMRIFGTDLRVAEVRRFHLTKIEQAMTGRYSSSTVRDTISVVQQVFNWAVRNDLLDYSPLAGYRKPAGGGRTRLITPDEFQALLRHADVRFRRFLIGLRLTGCRPGEIRTLTWSMVRLDDGLWVIPRHKTVTMQREPMPRVIPLAEPIRKLCQWLFERRSAREDHVFLNAHGKPYSKDCLVKKMSRVRQRAGIQEKGGENVVLYTHRHAYATNAIGSVSDTELAELMGHTTTRTLRRYVHLNSDRLRDIQRRIQGLQ
jgi:integrase